MDAGGTGKIGSEHTTQSYAAPGFSGHPQECLHAIITRMSWLARVGF